jgi:SAM-dependent methyltransferase
VRYKIASGIVVKTENAAKPESQRSAFLEGLISGLPQVESSFDYGCGKLRYLSSILEITQTLTLVDSEIQLSRTQQLKGRATTVRDILASSNRVDVLNDAEFGGVAAEFDRGFCINVLSVIPIYAKRRHVLKTIWQKLRPGGECLFVVQYRNSDFNRMRSLPNARPWRDGFLIDSLRGFSFYGLITPDRLASMLSSAGFILLERKLNQGSVFIIAQRPAV